MSRLAPGPPARADARSPGAGFVLVGVIIFVLALTIIGLSLFSLSSYEAEFLQRSLEAEQAFQAASGGLEWAQFVLELWGSHLHDVQRDSLPPQVVHAIAWQVKSGVVDSTGPVSWDPAVPVFVRVTAEAGGARRAVEAWFTPKSAPDYYRQLVTTGGGITVRPAGIAPNTPRVGTVRLEGTVWETSGQDTTTWTQWLASPPPTPIRTTPLVPVPDAPAFIAEHRNLVGPQVAHSGDPAATYVTTFDLTGGLYQFHYVTSDDPADPTWSLYEGVSIDFNLVRVAGCVVWLFPRGVQFYQPVEIRGAGGLGADCLVIVAGRSRYTNSTVPDADSAGIWFRGGLISDIPVVLASDGKVLVWHDNNYQGSSDVPELSIFAGSVNLMGPETPYSAALRHPPEGQMNNRFLPILLGNLALPNVTTASGHRLAQLRGTWRASTP